MGTINMHLSDNGRLVQIKGSNGTHGETRYAINHREFANLTGRVLTIADAAFTDSQQRKAAKDLFRQAIQDWAKDIAGMAENEASLEQYEAKAKADSSST